MGLQRSLRAVVCGKEEEEREEGEEELEEGDEKYLRLEKRKEGGQFEALVGWKRREKEEEEQREEEEERVLS